MKNITMRTALLFSAAVVFSAVAEARSRVIAYGWDVLRSSPEEFLANAEAWDGVPVDGVVFTLNATNPQGGRFMHRRVPTDKGWTYEAFAPQVPVIRRLVAKRNLSHSFAGAWFQGHKEKNRLDWRDDAAWANFASNMGVLARIVRESGLKGICIDNEDYGKCRQFYRKDGELPYAELRALARRRGREVFAPVFREKPDIALLAFWFLSYDADYLVAEDLMAKQRENGDLWPAFIEGMLEVMPEGATLHDGNEKAYYYRAETGDYFRSAVRIISRFAELLEPQFRDKYRARVRVSAGFYMDNYVQKDSSNYHYLPPTKGGTQVDRFCDNYLQADEACGGYIWFYGERHPWIDWKGGSDKPWRRAPTWNDAMPGLYDIFAAHRDPVSFAAAKSAAIDASGAATNLIVGGDCTVKVGGKAGVRTNRLPKGFDRWTHKTEKGFIGTDMSVGRNGGCSVCLDHVKRGCVIVRVNGLAPGKSVLFRLYAKGLSPRATAYYTEKKSWRFPLGNVRVKFDKPGADGWCAGYAVVTVPHGADGFAVQLGGNGDGKIWYDDIGAYLLR